MTKTSDAKLQKVLIYAHELQRQKEARAIVYSSVEAKMKLAELVNPNGQLGISD